MTFRTIFAALALAAAAGPASAHHVVGGALPRSLLEGLLSGLAHPLLGLDHFAALIAIGVLSATLAMPITRAALVPLAFLAAGALGAALHVRGASIPGAEVGVALSVAILGAAILLDRRLPLDVVAALLAAAGFFHGYALAEGIVGAEPAPLAAYFIGLAIVQYTIAVAVIAGARRMIAVRPPTARPSFAGTGAAAVVIGLGFLVLPLVS